MSKIAIHVNDEEKNIYMAEGFDNIDEAIAFLEDLKNKEEEKYEKGN